MRLKQAAEHIISRKHTSGLDLVASIDAALDASMESLRGFNTVYEQLRSRRLNRTKAHSLVVELAQAGAFAGHVPVSIFPRWNFLLLAVNQVVNHLDKFPLMSNNGYRPKVIIRTGIGSVQPLHPQHQHVGDFTDAFRLMCHSIEVIRLDEPQDIFPAYQKALEREDGKSTIVVEYGDYYNQK